jgi:hypothetical protein
MNYNNLTLQFPNLYTYTLKTLCKTVDKRGFNKFLTTLVNKFNLTNILYTHYTHKTLFFNLFKFQYFTMFLFKLYPYSHPLLKLLFIYKKRK